MSRKHIVLVGLTILILSSFCYAGLDEGIAALERKNYQQACKELWFLILIFCIVLYFIISGFFYEIKRTKALKQLAKSMNFNFDKKGNKLSLLSINHFQLFKPEVYIKFGFKTRNVMHGCIADTETYIMDYAYKRGSAHGPSKCCGTLIVITSNQLQLPVFELKPKDIIHKAAKLVGYQDIDFNTHPVFSKKFLLRGRDENGIRILFDSNRLEYFEQNEGLFIEGYKDSLLFYYEYWEVPPKKLKSFIQKGFELFNLFK